MGRVAEIAADLERMSHPDRVPVAREISNLSELVRHNVTIAEIEIGHWVGQIERIADSGYSPECLAMVRLENDEKTLRKLADRVGAQRLRLSKRHLVAAE